MSFADELRELGKEPRSSGRVDEDIQYWSEKLLRVIKVECQKASLEGRTSIYGYVCFPREGAGDHAARLDESLPLLKDFYSNIEDRGDDSQPREVRLYAGYIIPGNVNMLQKMEDHLKEELKLLGFTQYRVQKVQLMDVYVRYSARKSGKQPGRVSGRTAREPVYTLHFSISWEKQGE